MTAVTLTCRVLGHRPAFHAEGRTLRWTCARGCSLAAGSKQYPTAQDAQRCAAAFNQRDADELGKRAPLIGLFPLRLWRWVRTRRLP